MEQAAIASTPHQLPVSERPDGSDPAPVVLVIEDDPTLLSTLVYNLRREGCTVLTAATGEDGLQIARREEERIDLIVLDLMLPGLNGFHVLRQVRSRSDVPVLIVSARGEEQDRIDGLELGADDYVVKPFAMRELIARVRAGLRRKAPLANRPPSTLSRGPLTIELERHRALLNGRELPLRPKEFGLLVALAMEPGRVFSRQALLDRVWGEDVFVDERTVDVHLSCLRSKLTGAGGDVGMIRAVYGTGYRFMVPSMNAGNPSEAVRA